MFVDLHTLEITGELKEIEDAVIFAMKYLMKKSVFTRKENPGRLVYQITSDGIYCVGCIFGSIQGKEYEGWNIISFDYAPKILASVIKKHIKGQKKSMKKELNYDAEGWKYGFKLKNRDEDWQFENHIQNDIYCCFTVGPKWLYYGDDG